MLVVLPAPLGPMKPNTSPRCTENDNRSTALVDPNTRVTLSNRIVTSADEALLVAEAFELGVVGLVIFTMNHMQLKFVVERFDQGFDRRVVVDDGGKFARFRRVGGELANRRIHPRTVGVKES